VDKRQEQEQWLIDYVKNDQADGCTTSEIDLRYDMAVRFNIRIDWAYELVRKIVAKYPQLHLEKVLVEYGDGKGRVHPATEITWRD
jgi:hypothetical protein